MSMKYDPERLNLLRGIKKEMPPKPNVVVYFILDINHSKICFRAYVQSIFKRIGFKATVLPSGPVALISLKAIVCPL